jgi:hypothetical protein
MKQKNSLGGREVSEWESVKGIVEPWRRLTVEEMKSVGRNLLTKQNEAEMLIFATRIEAYIMALNSSRSGSKLKK